MGPADGGESLRSRGADRRADSVGWAPGGRRPPGIQDQGGAAEGLLA